MDPILIKSAVIVFWGIFLVRILRSLYEDFAANLLAIIWLIVVLSMWAIDHLSGQESHKDSGLQSSIVIMMAITLGEIFAKISLPIIKKLKSSEG